MRPIVLLVSLVPGLVAAGSFPSAAKDRLEAGSWRTEMRSPSGPLVMPPMATTRCIGPEETRKANGSASEIRAALEASSAGCRIGAVEAEGERVAFEQICGDGRQKIEFVYRGGTMTGRTVMSRPGDPDVVIEFSGSRIGPCP